MKRRTWIVLLLLVAGPVIITGCAKETPVAVTDLNTSLNQAKDACASVYASDSLATIQTQANEMNQLVADGKMKKAGKKAEALAPEVDTMKSKAQIARDNAKMEADKAVARAEEAVMAARRAEAGQYARSDFSAAEAKLKEAKAAASDPCAYGKAPALARDAVSAAEKSRTTAIAEAKRIAEQEAKRREEEARRLAEAEARRRAEEEARMHPPNYVVAKGDCLWNISGMQTIYKQSPMWPVIYDANRNVISDPDMIYPGQKLTIPRALTAEQMRKKVREMWAADISN